LMYWQHGDVFVSSYLSRHVINRATSNINQFNRGYGFYISVLRNLVSPWAYILPFSLIFAPRPRSFVVLILGLMVFGGYTLVQTKFQWYILPALPAFAVVIGGFLASFAKRKTQTQFEVGLLALIILWGFAEFRTIRLIKTSDSEIESAARLAQVSNSDQGGIIAYPESLGMTVKFYSRRPLCTDSVLSKLSHNENFGCEPTGPTHMILRTADRPTVATRFTINPLLEDGPLTYASIGRR
jgi:hypothetical protein